MITQLSRNSLAVFEEYLTGSLSLHDLDVWLTQAGFDEELPFQEREELAALLILVIDIGEGMATEPELRHAISELLHSHASAPRDDKRNEIKRRRAG
jgi:hypothetical protein